MGGKLTDNSGLCSLCEKTGSNRSVLFSDGNGKYPANTSIYKFFTDPRDID